MMGGRTYPGVLLLADHHAALDYGGAGVVDAVKHRLRGVCQLWLVALLTG